jgi:hypothetical protein
VQQCSHIVIRVEAAEVACAVALLSLLMSSKKHAVLCSKHCSSLALQCACSGVRVCIGVGLHVVDVCVGTVRSG